MSDSRKPATALLSDLSDHLCELAHDRLNIPKAMAKEFGDDVTMYLASLWGGQMLYIPKDMASQVLSRDAKIYAEFTGNNHAELARKYDLSLQHTYTIIKKEREKRSLKQKRLPIDI